MSKDSMRCNAGGGAIYGVGIFGAFLYYMQHTTTFLSVIVGIIKAILWPAVVVYKVFDLLSL